MAAAWAALYAYERVGAMALLPLADALREVDPHGLYRADAKTVNCVTPADDE